jgi:hypothetical protein
MMNQNHFWLTEDQFARLEVLLPIESCCCRSIRVASRGQMIAVSSAAVCLAAIVSDWL